MTEPLDKKVLILNAGFVPVYIASVKNVIRLLYLRKDVRNVVVVDEKFNTYSWDEWLEYSNLEENEGKPFISSTFIKILIPSVIRLVNYKKIHGNFKTHATRDNIFRRDNSKCQYCGEEVGRKEGTIDHIVPRSRREELKMSLEEFGSWENVVVACKRCNFKKGNRLLTEMGMTLRKKPTKFKWRNYFIRYDRKEWKPFLSRHVQAVKESHKGEQ